MKGRNCVGADGEQEDEAPEGSRQHDPDAVCTSVRPSALLLCHAGVPLQVSHCSVLHAR